MILSQPWKPEAQKQGAGRLNPPWDLREKPSHVSPQVSGGTSKPWCSWTWRCITLIFATFIIRPYFLSAESLGLLVQISLSLQRASHWL
jgi:hypothetical protein